MKVVFHEVARPQDESFRVLEVHGSNHPCSWHFHLEYQLGLVVQGSGQRIVGDNIAPLEAGDVSLLGPNLPHVWQFEAAGAGSPSVHAIVVYFREDSLGEEFFQRPEAAAIRRLLLRSAVGLTVRGRARRETAELLRRLPGCAGFQRVILLMQVLHLLAGSEELLAISSAGYLPRLPDVEGERLRRVCDHVQAHLAEPLSRDAVAAVAHLSPAAFSRFFRTRTGRTFQDFVTDLRIGRACRLLGERELNITEVSLACGFGNLASFNRAFRRAKDASPTQYRRRLPALN